MKTIGIKMMIYGLLLFGFPGYVCAGEVSISLDLSQYDTFNETIEIQYSGAQTGVATLNIYNDYKKTIELNAGTYELQLLVKNDSLNLIKLHPDRLLIDVTEDNQDFIVGISDSAGLGSGANDYIHAEQMEIEAEAPLITEKIYEWEDKTVDTGTITITAPDITGMKAIDYSLEDAEGNVHTWQLHKENAFKATIELPYGRYTEIGNPKIIAEDGIDIPAETIFEYDYYQIAFGQRYRISKDAQNLSNPPNMKLRKKLNEGSIEIKNLYIFAGNQVVLDERKSMVETGHYEVRENNQEVKDKESSDVLDKEIEIEVESYSLQWIIGCIGIFVVIFSSIFIYIYAHKRKG